MISPLNDFTAKFYCFHYALPCVLAKTFPLSVIIRSLKRTLKGRGQRAQNFFWVSSNPRNVKHFIRAGAALSISLMIRTLVPADIELINTYTLVLQDRVCLPGQALPLQELCLEIIGVREWLDIPHPLQLLQALQENKQSTGQQFVLQVLVSLKW